MATEGHTARCPQCGKSFGATVRICPDDGTVLEQSSAVATEVGKVLEGKYRLDAFISKGGMGAVYRASHIMLGKTVAVKLINQDLVTSPEIVRRFQREARAATALNHPNIVGVYDMGQTSDGTLYIAMEFINGPSLKSLIDAEGPVSPSRTVALLRQVASALAAAHRQEIVHRDLKPHNIMLARADDGREIAKLVDFGIAKTFDESTQLTMTGFVLGTPQYMAPEQAEGRPVDGRSDLYSLGVILYEMLSGDVPFSDPSTPMILIKHIKETPVLPSLKNPNAQISPELEGIAMRCLQKDPAARFQTAEEFGNALNAVPLTPGGEAIKKDPAAARAWDFSTIVTPSAPGAPTIPMPGPGATAATVAAAKTAATIPMPTPQQKTAIGQTAPPLPTVAATAATPGPAFAPTVPTPMPGAGATMSAPPVVGPPMPTVARPAVTPTPTVAVPAPSTSSSKGPLMMAAAIILVLIAAGAYLKFGRSSAPASPAPATTTASTASTAATAPPAATSAPPPAPTDPGTGAPAAPPASSSAPANPPAATPPSSTPPSSSAPSPPPSGPASSAAPAGKPASPAVARATSSGRPALPTPIDPARTATPAAQPPAAPPAPAAAFPANPAVAFRCNGAGDVCSAIR